MAKDFSSKRSVDDRSERIRTRRGEKISKAREHRRIFGGRTFDRKTRTEDHETTLGGLFRFAEIES